MTEPMEGIHIELLGKSDQVKFVQELKDHGFDVVSNSPTRFNIMIPSEQLNLFKLLYQDSNDVIVDVVSERPPKTVPVEGCNYSCCKDVKTIKKDQRAEFYLTAFLVSMPIVMAIIGHWLST